MAANLTQQSALGKDQPFIDRVATSLLAYCYVVTQEAGTVTNHAARLVTAGKVAFGVDAYAAPLARLMAAVDPALGTAYTSTNPPATANCTDAQITADVIVGFPLLVGS